jgi:HAD superfamily phosphoserine phosphatase-like hydrolase
MTKFIFDLDGTVTSAETLPLIAKHFHVEEAIAELTAETVQGNIPFIESFIRRVHVLGKLPISEISSLLANVSLYASVVDFIGNHGECCAIATGNLRHWVSGLMERVGCAYFCSDCEVCDNSVKKITHILKKENVVEHFQAGGDRVVFIGDGNNDVEAMRKADVSIASGLTHSPARSVLSVTNYLVFTEEALCRQLNQLL